MFESVVYGTLFFAVPIGLTALWAVSLVRWLSAKRRHKRTPDAVSPHELKRRKAIFLVVSVIGGLFLTVVIGFLVLLALAIAYM